MAAAGSLTTLSCLTVDTELFRGMANTLCLDGVLGRIIEYCTAVQRK